MTMPPVVDDPVTLFYRRQWPRARRRQPHRPAMETPERSDPRDEKLAPLDPAGIAPCPSRLVHPYQDRWMSRIGSQRRPVWPVWLVWPAHSRW